MGASYGAILTTLLFWWISTAAILHLDRLDSRTFPISFGAFSVLLLAALWGIDASSATMTTASIYCAFASGLVIWAWHVMSYYMGFVRGPRKTRCPPGLLGWRRFVEALRASLYHEIAIAACALALLAMTWGSPNLFGLWTFLVLWWMHSSAKLNLFFGVPNLSDELLPDHMRYLVSFMARRPMNLFFPFSVSISTVFIALLAQRAIAAETEPEIVGYWILTTLMALAVIEHWLLVAPIDVNALWRLAAPTQSAASSAQGEKPTASEGLRLSALTAPRAAEEI